jgi:hypothetical protein
MYMHLNYLIIVFIIIIIIEAKADVLAQLGWQNEVEIFIILLFLAWFVDVSTRHLIYISFKEIIHMLVLVFTSTKIAILKTANLWIDINANFSFIFS